MTSSPTVIVLGGVNGAGKTTSSRALLAGTLKLLKFLNADIIAQGLCGFDPAAAAIRAGRIMLSEMKELAVQRESFAFETTLAARTYAGWLNRLRESGYEVHLFYFWLESADLAVSRVRSRVTKGGHNVPEATIRQRYLRSVRNLSDLYIPIVTSWKVYDNTLDGEPYAVAEGNRNEQPFVFDRARWQMVMRSADNGFESGTDDQ